MSNKSSSGTICCILYRWIFGSCKSSLLNPWILSSLVCSLLNLWILSILKCSLSNIWIIRSVYRSVLNVLILSSGHHNAALVIKLAVLTISCTTSSRVIWAHYRRPEVIRLPCFGNYKVTPVNGKDETDEEEGRQELQQGHSHLGLTDVIFGRACGNECSKTWKEKI